MRPWVKSLWHGVQYCADCLVLLACWTLWIVLGGLILVQLGIAFSRELAVPDFVLRSIESRFTASHVNARFGRATFDPTGRILIENLSLSLPEFDEPIVTVRAVQVELQPWLLLAGKLEARRVQATDIRLSVPAMLAPSGRSEEMLSGIDFAVTPENRELVIEHFTARFAGVALQLHGGFHLPPRTTTEEFAPLPLIEYLAQNYSAFCRQLVRAADELTAFDQPMLRATLAPSSTRGAIAHLNLIARQLKLPRFHGVTASELNIAFFLPVLGDAPVTSPLTVTADEVRTTDGATMRFVQAQVQGVVSPAHFYYEPKEIELTVAEARARGFSLFAVASQLAAHSPSDWEAGLIALSAGSPLALQGRVEVATKSAEIRVQGGFAPALLESIGTQIGRDVRPFVGFGEPVAFDLGASFKPGWKFERLAGRVAARKVDAYRVLIDEVAGEVEFDGRHFRARNTTARLGSNRAEGSFEQDLATKEFRFLLEGNLRPLEISGWFGEWWPNFFGNFEFPSAPPTASVDVAGRWRAGHETTVFVFAESTSPIIRGTPLDYGRTLMFIRPNFFDGLEFFGTRGAGEVSGMFVRRIDLPRREWTEMTFALTSTLDLPTGKGLLGPALATRLEPFTFGTAPQVQASGRLTGPAAPEGEHQSMKIRAQSTGEFSIYDFPARDVSFDATLEDDDLKIERLEAEVASGSLTGSARLWRPENKQKLAFDAALHSASLNEAVAVVSDYSARRRGQPPSNPDTILSGKSEINLDLALAAEGNFEDFLSYQGTGNAVLTGDELGEVRLLGLLSDLLDFTALRFTTARLNFALEGNKVVFPTLNVTGAHSAIEGHGDYSLERDQIDLNARVYPFQESKSFLQNVVGAVLIPLSTALEVKLTGALKQPKWAFVLGPTNFLRSLTQPTAPLVESPPQGEPSPYLKR